jgi:hypothetical protein
MLNKTQRIILNNLIDDELRNAQDLNFFVCKEHQEKYLNNLELIKKELK